MYYGARQNQSIYNDKVLLVKANMKKFDRTLDLNSKEPKLEIFYLE